MRLLVRDRHVEHDAVEPLHLVRIEPALGGRAPQAHEQSVLAQRVAERPGGFELAVATRSTTAMRSRSRSRKRAVDRLDRFAQRLQVVARSRGRIRLPTWRTSLPGGSASDLPRLRPRAALPIQFRGSEAGERPTRKPP